MQNTNLVIFKPMISIKVQTKFCIKLTNMKHWLELVVGWGGTTKSRS